MVEHSELKESLLRYARDTENPIVNFQVAVEYKKIGQTAAAISFFLRCADRATADLDLAYECLLHIGECFDLQGDRHEHVRCMYKHAISILPKRPEAYYYLANFQTWHKQYQDTTYLTECALNTCDFNQKDFLYKSKYKGKWCLLYENAYSYWWWGKTGKCRDYFYKLIDLHWDEMDEFHQKAVQEMVSKIGYCPKSQDHVNYYQSDHKKLRYKFPRFETIERNYSQAYQDMFVLSMLKGKINGKFVEIGGCDPFHGNNTALLESKFGWTGLTVELESKHVTEYRRQRPLTNVYHSNALQLDYRSIIKQNFGQVDVIDYLQLDIEPAKNTYELLLKIPFDTYKFAVITYEHDDYVDVTKKCKENSRKYLTEKGYVLVAGDISTDGVSSFEDWWVHPDLVDANILERMKSNSSCVLNAKDYMLSDPDEKCVAKVYAKCKCSWCVKDKFPRLTKIKEDTYWFEIPKNGSASIKTHFRDHYTLSVEEYNNIGDIKPIVIFDDPIDRFVTLLNDYFVRGNYHHIWGQDILAKVEQNLFSTDKERIIDIVFKNFSLLDTRQQVHHFYPQTYFIDQERFDSFEIIKKSDLSLRFPEMEHRYNVTRKEIQRSDLTEDQIDRLKDIYSDDYDFIKKHELKNIKKEIAVINSKNTSKGSIWVYDNFYENPDEIREFALNVEYFDGGFGRGFIGRRSAKQYLFPGLKERFEEIMGMKITAWEGHDMNGRFQTTIAGDPLVYHCDAQQWGAMLYLTPKAPYSCGTTLWGHKINRARNWFDPGWDEAWKHEDWPGDPHLDGTHFEPVDVIGNVYNRLFIFDACHIHSASQYFGGVPENGRLWQMFFFDAE